MNFSVKTHLVSADQQLDATKPADAAPPVPQSELDTIAFSGYRKIRSLSQTEAQCSVEDENDPANDEQDVHAVHRRMVETGQMWRRISSVVPLDRDRPIMMLSQRNLRILKKKVGPLSELEQTFVKKLSGQPWFLTRFVSGNSIAKVLQRDKVCLKSYDRSMRDARGAAVYTNASLEDVRELAGTDFVYFCLEIGKMLKKTRTRSPQPDGSFIIRTKLQQPAMRYAMSTFADIFDNLQAGRQLKISEDERVSLNQRLAAFARDPLNDYNGFARTVFYTPAEIQEGSTLQMILNARCLPETTRDTILKREGSQKLNDVVRSLSCVQVMVPSECVLRNFELYKKDA